jgi:ketosteroid isomerase-like protein
MRAILIALVLGGALVAAAALVAGRDVRPRPAAITPADEAAIHAVLARQQAAWNRGDIQAFMQGYHRRPDIVFTSGGNVRRGFGETLAAYETKYGSGDTMGRLDFTDVTLQSVGADGAVALGRYSLTDTPRASTGVFSLVFTQEGGRWGIVHDHTSVAVP